MTALVSQTSVPFFSATLGSELMAALDVVGVSTLGELPAARAGAVQFADCYGFRIPGADGAFSSLKGFREREVPFFTARMKSIFDDKVTRIASNMQVLRLYRSEELIHADVPAAVAAGLLEKRVAEMLFSRVEKNAARRLEFSSSQFAVNPWRSRRWVAGKIAADTLVFGAAFVFTGELALAALMAGATAVNLEGSSFALGRFLARRSARKIAARVAELEEAKGRAEEQRAALGSDAAEFAGVIELRDEDLYDPVFA